MWTLRKDKEGVAKREWSGLGQNVKRVDRLGWLDWKKFVNKREWLAVAALHKLNSKAKGN